MHNIKEKLMEELCEIEEKMKKAGAGKISAGDLEYIHKLTDSIKNIDKIEVLESNEGYSEAMGWMDGDGMYGASYARGRGRGRNARRDSMGRYSRDGGEYSEEGGMSYRGGSSYARGGQGSRGGRGGYSRADAKEHMIERMEDMMEEAETPKEKEAIRQCIMKIEQA